VGVGLLGAPVLAGVAVDCGGDLAPVVLPAAVDALLWTDGGRGAWGRVRVNGLKAS